MYGTSTNVGEIWVPKLERVHLMYPLSYSLFLVERVGSEILNILNFFFGVVVLAKTKRWLCPQIKFLNLNLLSKFSSKILLLSSASCSSETSFHMLWWVTREITNLSPRTFFFLWFLFLLFQFYFLYLHFLRKQFLLQVSKASLPFPFLH